MAASGSESDGIGEFREQPNECGICGKLFASKFSLQRHTSVHGTYDFKCEVCEKEFPNKYTYKEHMNTHNKDKNICPTCGKSFSTPYWLNRHEETVHGKVAKFKCLQCGKACSCRAVLSAHVARHGTNPKPYHCSKCGRDFMYKISSDRHERTCKNPQDKKTRFVCTVCNKSFKLARLLKQHNYVHLPPRYTCHVCGRGFRWKMCLTIHMKCCLVEKK